MFHSRKYNDNQSSTVVTIVYTVLVYSRSNYLVRSSLQLRIGTSRDLTTGTFSRNLCHASNHSYAHLIKSMLSTQSVTVSSYFIYLPDIS